MGREKRGSGELGGESGDSGERMELYCQHYDILIDLTLCSGLTDDTITCL